MRRLLAIATLALLTLAAPAGAATVDLEFRGDPRRNNDTYIVLKASPGERNQVTAEQVGTTLTLRDAGAPITIADNRCTAVEGGVTCPGGYLELHLGDQDDVATVDATVFGGPGNDRLTGNGEFSGGPGEDVLEGPGPFADDDGDTPAHDVYRGTGKTELSYGKRRAGIRVDLRRGRAAEDTVSGIPDVEGGYGDDVLIGDDGPNDLKGGPGNDRLVGLAGNDSLDPGGSRKGGPQHADGGSGADDISGGANVTARCGPGTDNASGSRVSFIAGDCETVQLDAADARFTPARTTFLTLRDCECRTYTFRVLARDRQLVARASGREGTVRLRLNAVGRRLLQQRGRLDVTVTAREGDVEEGFRARLKRRR